MKTTAQRYIELPKEARTKLMQLFGCKEKLVVLALTYRKNSDLAQKIRFTAVKHFKGTPMVHIPECDCLFITTKDNREIMRQVFENGAVLEADKKTGDVIVTNYKNEIVGKWEHVELTTLAQIQLLAESL